MEIASATDQTVAQYCGEVGDCVTERVFPSTQRSVDLEHNWLGRPSVQIC